MLRVVWSIKADRSAHRIVPFSLLHRRGKRASAYPRATPDGDCKFWLEPSIFLASNRGVRSHDLRQIERLVFENQEELKKAYYERHPR